MSITGRNPLFFFHRVKCSYDLMGKSKAFDLVSFLKVKDHNKTFQQLANSVSQVSNFYVKQRERVLITWATGRFSGLL